jgi:tetratricopeptide (TPR) repeat protein
LSQIPERESAALIQQGIDAVRADEFLLGFTLLSEAYRGPVENKTPDGLSFYGLCLALVEKKYKPAIELCRRAVELQFYHAEHYVNLAKVYLAAGNRKKAVTTLEDGLKVLPDDESLIAFRRQVGVRSRPAIPFLPRSNPLNIAIGRAVHARKVARARKKAEERAAAREAAKETAKEAAKEPDKNGKKPQQR